MSSNSIYGFCDSPAGSESVPCARCGTKFHALSRCTGLSDNAIKCVLDESDSGLQYVCTLCRCTEPGSPTVDGQESQRGMGQLYHLVKSLALSVSVFKYNRNCSPISWAFCNKAEHHMYTNFGI